MVKDKNEKPGQGPDDLVIARARDAAVECVAAVQAFFNAATEWEQSYEEFSCDWYKHNPIDYRPHIARLYRSLQVGFDRMFAVWPQVKEAFRRGSPGENLLPHEMVYRSGVPGSYMGYHDVVPVQAWMLANAVLWQSIYASEYWNPAYDAWYERKEDFIPDLSDYPSGDVEVWSRGLREAENFEAVWMHWVAEIRTTPPSASEEDTSADSHQRRRPDPEQLHAAPVDSKEPPVHFIVAYLSWEYAKQKMAEQGQGSPTYAEGHAWLQKNGWEKNPDYELPASASTWERYARSGKKYAPRSDSPTLGHSVVSKEQVDDAEDEDEYAEQTERGWVDPTPPRELLLDMLSKLYLSHNPGDSKAETLWRRAKGLMERGGYAQGVINDIVMNRDAKGLAELLNQPSSGD